ncbi:MAG: ABC-2 family transporter protein [Patescibacteria group bacterium]
MKKELHFALLAIKKNLQSSAELRTSFLMNVIGMIFNDIAFILIWLFLIKTTGNIGGWGAADIFGLQGFVALSFGLVLSFGAGLRNMSPLVNSGVFDQLLLSPKNLIVRVATSSFSASVFGDIVFGIACISIYLVMIHATGIQVLLTIILLFFGTVAFFGVVLLVQSISFYFVDSENINTSIFDLFLMPSMFYGGAFQGSMRFIYTFIIPALVIGTLPVEAITHLSYQKVFLVVILSIAWFCLSLLVFKKAVKKYESANFMTFGS